MLAARLSDAAFFWDNDLREARAGMKDWAEGLKAVTFHAKLGSQANRVERIAALSREIAPAVGADPALAEQAAKVAKLDLRSAMVGEFPELQGTMGRYYARAAGLPDAVAAAASDHYSPLGPSDEVPVAPVSVAVALADKLDTLTGFWAIDEKPTGSKDPFALRRAALGVIRLVLGNGVRISVNNLSRSQIIMLFSQMQMRGFEAQIEDLNALPDDVAGEARLRLEGRMIPDDPDSGAQTLGRHEDWGAQTAADLLAFLHDRLKVHLRDQGIRHDIIDAVLTMPGSDDLVLVVKRAEALAAFLKTEDGTNLLQGLKRTNNILSQAEDKDGVEYSFGADPKYADTDQERALFAALDATEPAIRAAVAAEDFPAAMSAIAALRAPVDAFFEAVQVNSDNQILRRNRLNLLSRIRETGRLIADFGRIEG